MSLSGFAWSRQGRHCASRPRAIKPARARTARRVGSARAAKVVLRRSGDIPVPVFVFNELVKYTTTQNLSRSQAKGSPPITCHRAACPEVLRSEADQPLR